MEKYFQKQDNITSDGKISPSLNKNRRKCLLTMDRDLDADYDGIRKINVIDWLLRE